MRVSAAEENCRGAIRSRPAGLLLREPADERGIGDHHLRLVGIQGVDHFGKRRGDGQARSVGAPGAKLGEQAVRHVKRGGRADANHAGLRGDPLNCQHAQQAGDRNVPRGLVVDHDAPLAGRAAAGDDAILAEQRLACPLAGQMLLGLGQSQPPVRDDPVEFCHQRGLGQDRQPLQVDVAVAHITDDPAVVGRVRDRVLHDLAQAGPLVFEQSRTRPALASEHLVGQCLDPLEVVVQFAPHGKHARSTGEHGAHGRLLGSKV